MNKVTANGILGISCLAIPLGAELATATPGNVPGTGFSVLLYEPFDFAYVILVLVFFVALNVHYSVKVGASWVTGALSAVGMTAIWFLVTFLAVGQVHIGLGGKL